MCVCVYNYDIQICVYTYIEIDIHIYTPIVGKRGIREIKGLYPRVSDSGLGVQSLRLRV